jgi:hypothetical protein
MSKTQSIFGLLLFLIIIFSMNMIFGNVLNETFTTNRNIAMPSPSVNQLKKTRINTLNDNNIEKFLGRMSPQNQNDDQPLYFGFSL